MAEQQTGDSSKALQLVIVSENGVEFSLLKEPNETSMYVMEDHKTLNENLQVSAGTSIGLYRCQKAYVDSLL